MSPKIFWVYNQLMDDPHYEPFKSGPMGPMTSHVPNLQGHEDVVFLNVLQPSHAFTKANEPPKQDLIWTILAQQKKLRKKGFVNCVIPPIVQKTSKYQKIYLSLVSLYLRSLIHWFIHLIIYHPPFSSFSPSSPPKKRH